MFAAYLLRKYRQNAVRKRSRSFSSGDWDPASPIGYWTSDVAASVPRSVAKPGLSTFQLSFRIGAVFALGSGIACWVLESDSKAGSLQANAQLCVEGTVRQLRKLLNMNPTSSNQPQPALAAKMFQSPDTSGSTGSEPSLNSDRKEHTPEISEPPETAQDEASAIPSHVTTSIVPPSKPGLPSDESKASHEETNSISTTEQPQTETMSVYERLQAALEELAPVLGRANLALSSSVLDVAQLPKEEIRSTTEQLPRDVRDASKLSMAPVLHTEGVMGIDQNISSVSLLSSNPAASNSDWASLGTATRQAAADVEEIRRVLGQVEKHNHKELEKAVAEEKRLEAVAKENLSVAANALQYAQSTLESNAQAAERNADAAVQLQELHLTVKFEAAANKERAKRLTMIDEVRLDANALHAGHEQVRDQLKRAAERNAEAAAVVKLCTSLQNGHVSTDDVAEVVKDGTNELTRVAVDSIMPAATQEGLNTVDDLQKKWPGIRRSIRTGKALAPDEKAGFFSTCLAALSASLKVSEASTLKLGKEMTMETRLAAIDQAISNGDIVFATGVLEELCESVRADSQVHSYVDSLRTRAVVDQLIAVLLAQQTALSAAQ